MYYIYTIIHDSDYYIVIMRISGNMPIKTKKAYPTHENNQI